MTDWPSAFGPVVKQDVTVRARGRGKCSPPGDKETWEGLGVPFRGTPPWPDFLPLGRTSKGSTTPSSTTGWGAASARGPWGHVSRHGVNTASSFSLRPAASPKPLQPPGGAGDRLLHHGSKCWPRAIPPFPQTEDRSVQQGVTVGLTLTRMSGKLRDTPGCHRRHHHGH